MKKSEFKVPSLAEADPQYNDLLNRKWALVEKQHGLIQEQDTLRGELRDLPRVLHSEDVLQLLGEASPDQAAQISKVKRLREISKEAADIETALAIIDRRLSERRGVASSIITQAVRPEYGRRVKAVCEALLAVKTARADYDAMVREFEVEDVLWTSLDPMALGFLGDARDGAIDRVIRDARGAGYVN